MKGPQSFNKGDCKNSTERKTGKTTVDPQFQVRTVKRRRISVNRQSSHLLQEKINHGNRNPFGVPGRRGSLSVRLPGRGRQPSTEGLDDLHGQDDWVRVYSVRGRHRLSLERRSCARPDETFPQ